MHENELVKGPYHTLGQYMGQARIPIGYTQGIEIIRCNRPLSTGNDLVMKH